MKKVLLKQFWFYFVVILLSTKLMLIPSRIYLISLMLSPSIYFDDEHIAEKHNCRQRNFSFCFLKKQHKQLQTRHFFIRIIILYIYTHFLCNVFEGFSNRLRWPFSVLLHPAKAFSCVDLINNFDIIVRKLFEIRLHLALESIERIAIRLRAKNCLTMRYPQLSPFET